MIAAATAASVVVSTISYGLHFGGLPIVEPERVVDLRESAPRWGRPRMEINYADFEVWSKTAAAFESLAVYYPQSFNVAGQTAPERVAGIWVTTGFARVLGTSPVLGRDLSPDDAAPGALPVALISHAFWTSRFDRDPAVIGRILRVDGVDTAIVGVFAEHAGFPTDAQMWIPLHGDAYPTIRRYRYTGIGRLKPGLNTVDASKDLLRAHAATWEQWDKERIVSPLVTPIREHLIRDYRALVWAFIASACLLLAAMSINLLGTSIADVIVREGEYRVRLAAGASPAQIARLAGIEMALVVAGAGALGLGVGVVLTRAFVRVFAGTLPWWAVSHMEFLPLLIVLLANAAVVVAVTGATFLVIRAAARRGGPRFGPRTFRAMFGVLRATVLFEVAIAAILMTVDARLTRGILARQDRDLGFTPAHVVLFAVQLPDARYKDNSARTNLWMRLDAGIAEMPGGATTGLVNCPPFASGCNLSFGFEAEGEVPPPGVTQPLVLTRAATAGYFSAIGLRLKTGRFFRDSDSTPSPLVAVVDETFVRTFLKDAPDPVGRHVRPRGAKEWLTVIGVAATIPSDSPESGSTPLVYVPLPFEPRRVQYAVMRTGADATGTMAQARSVLRRLDPELAMFDVGSMDGLIARTFAVPQAILATVLMFAACALAVAIAGAWSAATCLQAFQERHLAIRICLGATPGRLLMELARTNVLVGACGVLVGQAAVVLLLRVFGTPLVPGMERAGWTDVAVVTALVAVVAFTNLRAAMDALRRDPVRLLRSTATGAR